MVKTSKRPSCSLHNSKFFFFSAVQENRNVFTFLCLLEVPFMFTICSVCFFLILRTYWLFKSVCSPYSLSVHLTFQPGSSSSSCCGCTLLLLLLLLKHRQFSMTGRVRYNKCCLLEITANLKEQFERNVTTPRLYV